MKSFTIEVTPYGGTVYVVIGNKKYLFSALQGLNAPDSLIADVGNEPPAHKEVGCTYNNEGNLLLWLGEWQNSFDDLDTLIHETNHVVYYISKWYGFEDEPEAIAYLQCYLVKKIREQLTP